MDLTTGQCSVSTIPDSVDSVSVAGGNIRMRNSTQFFDLDSDQYQYMGIVSMFLQPLFSFQPTRRHAVCYVTEC